MSAAEELTPEELEEFEKHTARGLGPLVNVHAMYTLAEVGSPQEKQTEDALAEMVEDTVRNHPDKAETIIAGLLALVFHLRTGNDVFSFFEGTRQHIFPILSHDDPSAPPR